ncbi:hypothetical protein [Pseudomonas mosselii]|uniref:hypothetical protein n=1 Tax=Pseudomonas mosselii TaxID=78327 RepID=UPI0021D829CC|nr:hypothetical protein [Pseudomonas mosselii]MCU9528551.1 hypothetical protein [Pseudomonas mosselii]MCU9535885.1 hypothetical protein [Pseudomonas mosselii]MCU9542943.1 hypothetical protein [Pseudomonas mosselii]MCU9548824.1 hypothetical protein [Pseudomonas mosselii]
MKENIKTQLIPMIDTVVIAAAKLLWKVMKVFDPRPIQEHYAARMPASSVAISKCFSLNASDSELNIARIANMYIGSSTGRGRKGLVGRKGLIKIFNAENGKFLMIRAQGVATRPGENQIPRDGIALNYDAKKALGIPKNQEVDLQLHIGLANVGDQEFYHMYQDPDQSSRTARALGWYLAIGGFVYGLLQLALGCVEAFIAVMF